MRHTLYTYGYLAGTPEELVSHAEAGVLVLDIRINPTSRNPVWRQGHLRKLLANRYAWCPELGNPNYKSKLPPTLADVDAGMKTLRPLLQETPVVMLCACRDWHTCHRRLAAEAWQELAPDWPVVHLEPGDTVDA
jgi:hypothetical protein